jgi:hypothetical protein
MNFNTIYNQVFLTYFCNFRLSTYFQSVLYKMIYWHNLILLMMSTCCSKHVEAWNKYIEKSASSWSLTRITSRCAVNKILNMKYIYCYHYPVTSRSYKFTLAYYSNYTQGRIEVAGRRGRRSKQMLNGLKEKRTYYKLKREALDRPLCRTGFVKGYGTNHSTLWKLKLFWNTLQKTRFILHGEISQLLSKINRLVLFKKRRTHTLLKSHTKRTNIGYLS